MKTNAKRKAKAEWTGTCFKKSIENFPKTVSPIKLLQSWALLAEAFIPFESK